MEYVYHKDQPGLYGEGFDWDYQGANTLPEKDVWHHIEQYVRMNTIGSANGIIRIWLDGVLVMEETGFEFRIAGATFTIDNFYFSTHMGGSGSEYAPDVDVYAYFDDLTISTHRSWSAFDVSITDGGTGISTTPTITWDHVDYIDDVDVWLDKAACSTVECDTGGVGTSDDDADKTWTPGTLDENSTYCLGVKINVGALTGDCQEFEFTTTEGPPPPPTGLSTISYHSLGMTGSYAAQGSTVGE